MSSNGALSSDTRKTREWSHVEALKVKESKENDVNGGIRARPTTGKPCAVVSS